MCYENDPSYKQSLSTEASTHPFKLQCILVVVRVFSLIITPATASPNLLPSHSNLNSYHHLSTLVHLKYPSTPLHILVSFLLSSSFILFSSPPLFYPTTLLLLSHLTPLSLPTPSSPRLSEGGDTLMEAGKERLEEEKGRSEGTKRRRERERECV